MGTGKTIILIDGEAPPRFIPSTRFTLALLVFFAFIVQYSQRVNLPIGIVCMVNRTRVNEHRLFFNQTTISTDLADKNILHASPTLRPIVNAIQKIRFLQEKQFNWIELQQQILLGGYWAGYIFTQIPGKCFLSCRFMLIDTTLIMHRRMVSDNHRCKMGLCRFTLYQFCGQLGFNIDVYDAKYTFCSNAGFACYHWSCSRRSFSGDDRPLVTMGSTTRTKYTGLYWILWYTPRYIVNDAPWGYFMPLFVCGLDVYILPHGDSRFSMVSIMDSINGGFTEQSSTNQ